MVLIWHANSEQDKSISSERCGALVFRPMYSNREATIARSSEASALQDLSGKSGCRRATRLGRARRSASRAAARLNQSFTLVKTLFTEVFTIVGDTVLMTRDVHSFQRSSER